MKAKNQDGGADGNALDMRAGKIQGQTAQISAVLWVIALKNFRHPFEDQRPVKPLILKIKGGNNQIIQDNCALVSAVPCEGPRVTGAELSVDDSSGAMTAMERNRLRPRLCQVS